MMHLSLRHFFSFLFLCAFFHPALSEELLDERDLDFSSSSLSSLPSADLAYAAVMPETVQDPVTAALAIQVPDPNTFMKDDEFISQLEQEEKIIKSKQEEEIAQTSEEASRNHQEFRDYATQQVRNDAKNYGETAGKHVGRLGKLFPSNGHPSQSTAFPLHDQAPHQRAHSRRYRDARGHFNINKAYAEQRRALGLDDFPHHGGHTKSPHNSHRHHSSSRSNKPRRHNKHKAASRLRKFPKHGGRKKKSRSKKSRKSSLLETESESESEQTPPPAAAAAAAAPVATAQAATEFGDQFPHIDDQRANLRATKDFYDDLRHQALKAKKAVEELKSHVEKREKILKAYESHDFLSNSNVYTLYGAQNGVFDRIPSSPTQGRRGSMAKRSWTPARRLLPQRIAKLEDKRMDSRRRNWTRGGMAHTYHKQVHGDELGVATPITPDQSLIEVSEEGVFHDRPSTISLPPF